MTEEAAAAIYGSSINLLGAGCQIFGGREQNAAPVDAAAIRKLTSQIPGQVITPEAPDCRSRPHRENRELLAAILRKLGEI